MTIQQASDIVTQLRNKDQSSKELLELQRILHNELTEQLLPGKKYTDWLSWFHDTLKPNNYLEIGVESGKTLQLANDTIAIGVDPNPQIIYPLSATTQVFSETSDEFFLRNVKSIAGNIEFAFIDGLHHYDQVLRDFINIERISNTDTVIVLHDVYPVIPETAVREWTTFYWAGDTWKIMHILNKYRKDLVLKTIPTFPTGLGFITNLNPDSNILSNHFNDIVNEFADMKYDISNSINLIKNNYLEIYKLLPSMQAPVGARAPYWVS